MKKLIASAIVIALLLVGVTPSLVAGASNTLDWSFDTHGADGWVCITASTDGWTRELEIGCGVLAEWWTMRCDVEVAVALFEERYYPAGYYCVDLDSDSATIWWGGTAGVYAEAAFTGGNGYGIISLGRAGVDVKPYLGGGGGVAIYNVDFTESTPTFTRDRDAELTVLLLGIIGGILDLAGYIG